MKDRLLQHPGLVRRLSSLNDFAAKIGVAQSREEIFGVLRSEGKWLFDYEILMTNLLNQGATHYVINTHSPVADASDLNHKHFSAEEGMPGWVADNQAAIIEDILSCPAFSPAIEGKIQELGIKSLLIVPMRSGNRIAGSLTLGSVRASHYTAEDSIIAQLVGIHLSTALEHVSSLENARKRISQIELIYEVTAQMASMLQLDDLLGAAAASIQRNFNYFDVTVFLFSPADRELILEAHSGSFVDFLPHGYRQRPSQGIIGWVFEKGERVICNDVSQDPRYVAYAYHNTKSEMAIPIKIDSETVGVLNVEDTRLHAFDETDGVVLQTLSDQLGIAIRNARLYDEVRKANMKLTELDKLKSEFLGIVSHDFRSPLSSIILAGKSLLKHEAVLAAPRIREYLHIIVDQANRLNQLAEDTLSIAKIESGQLSYYFKIVNVERLIQDAVSMVRFSSRHAVDYKIEPTVAFIKGDQTKLRQVVQNLVSNAAKYSPRGGKIRISAQESPPDKIILSVSDEGIGIPPSQISKLFQKFSRADTENAKDIKGAGLGLWICREVVEAHGGKIWIESEEGKGTTVKFTLKRAG